MTETTSPAMPEARATYTLWQLVGYMLGLGTWGFGGPVALVGYMYRDLVERRRWISEGDPQGITQRAITDLMASDPNTITSTIARMEKAGLVERRPHETDRRAHRVRLLPLGRKTFEKARKEAVELQHQILTVLPEAERDSFLEALQLIADACAMATQQPTKKRRKKD